MGKRAKCEQHPEESVVGQCLQCGKPICRLCRQELGYFCSEECRAAKQEDSDDFDTEADRAEVEAVRANVQKWMRLATRRILPGLGALLLLWIAIAVLSDAGEVIWEWKPPGDAALSIAALDEKAVYVGDAKGKLHALDKETGQPLWSTDVGGDLTDGGPLLCAPEVCLGWNEAGLAAVARDTGEVRWRWQAAGKLDRPPLAAGSVVCCQTSTWKKWKPDPKTARAQDEFAAVFGGGDGGPTMVRDQTALQAIAIHSGEALWTMPLAGAYGLWTAAPDGKALYSQVITPGDERREGAASGAIRAWDLNSGAELWTTVIDGPVYALKAVEAGALVTTDTGYVFVSAQGKQTWSRSCSDALTKPQLAAGRLYLAQEDELVCVDLAGGEQLWKTELSDELMAFVVGERYVFVAAVRAEELSEERKAALKRACTPPKEMYGVKLKDILGEGAEIDPGLLVPDSECVPVLAAFDREEGEEEWTADAEAGALQSHGPHLLCISAAGGFSLLDQEFSRTTTIDALKAGSGSRRWRFRHKGTLVHAALDEGAVFLVMHEMGESLSFSFGGEAPPPRGNVVRAVSIGW